MAQGRKRGESKQAPSQSGVARLTPQVDSTAVNDWAKGMLFHKYRIKHISERHREIVLPDTCLNRLNRHNSRNCISRPVADHKV
jgi:hypothetical protein